ncbi:MAG: PBP1 and LysM peptidoglycan-binding domain-containing protein [Bacteroidota bacterium]
MHLKKILLLIGLFLTQLSYGQTLTKKDTADIRFLNSRKFFIYKVEKGETLFSISQKFNIPQEEIIQFNKDISQQGLKAKTKLWIPAYSWLNKNNKTETETEEAEEIDPGKKSYKIAIVSTLNLPKLYLPDTTELDSSYVDEAIEREIMNNLSFIEGAMRSAEILKTDGFRSHVLVLDSEQDSVKLGNKLKLHSPDLIITNENGSILKFLTDLSDHKNIRLLSCGINTTELISDSKNSIALFPSSLSQCEEMGYFNAKYFPGAVGITIRTTQAKENERSTAFKNGWKTGGGGKMIYLDYSKGGAKAIADSLSKSKNNVIFISSSNEDIVSTILGELKEHVGEKTITVAGLPTWQYFETIDQNLMDKCNVYIFSSGFIRYGSSPVENFRKYFRETYNGEPSESAFQGYDAMMFAGKNLMKFGKKFITTGKTMQVDGIYSEYIIENSAKENKIIHVFQPTKDDQIDYFIKINKK